MKKTKVPECSHGLRHVFVWAAEHLHLVGVWVRVRARARVRVRVNG